MIRTNRRLINFIVTLVLLFSLMPIVPTQASVAYFTFPFASSPSAALNNPVNVSVIASFNGSYSQTVPTSLTYSVQQMEQATDGSGSWDPVGTPQTAPNATPIISGPSNQDFTFTNVQLFDGMNKVTVTTPDGTEGSCYIYYDSAPVIYNITLSNGQSLSPSAPVIVDTQTQFLNIQTANADTVMVGNVEASKYGPNSFDVSNYSLNPGLNTLTFVAKTDNRSYTITRQIVFMQTPGTLYNTYLQDPTTHSGGLQLDGNPILTQKPLPEELTGLIVVPSGGNALDTPPTINQLSITMDNTQAVLSEGNLNNAQSVLNSQTQFVKDDGAGHLIYSYTIDLTPANFSIPPASWPITTPGIYNITLNGTYVNGQPAGNTFTSTMLFTFKDGTNPTINGVDQLFGADANGLGGVASPFANSDSSLPLYARLDLSVPSGKTAVPSITATQGGITKNVSFTQISSDPNDPSGSERVRIDSLPFVGDMTLTFNISDTSGNLYDSYTTSTISYIPTPSISVNQLYDGMNVSTPNLPAFSGNLYNFTPADLTSQITFTVNGVDESSHLHVNTSDGSFTVDQLLSVLVEGANDIKLSATAQGVPIYTRLTVYYFTNDSAVIENPFPVPVSVPPASPATNDVNGLFPPDSSAAQTYDTTEKSADIIFGISNADTVVVMNNGQQYFSLDFKNDMLQESLPMALSNPNTTLSEVPELEPNPQTSPKTYYFRISNFPLTLGTNSLVIKGLKGPTSVFTPISIVRSIPPYQVLSPKLPEESVVNQNYVPVTIRADGADSVLIGKTPMVKTTDPASGEDFFNLEVDNLKAGTNTIKYTIVRGANKTNDQFNVDYANTNTVGGQFKSPMPTSGKLSAFNGAVSLSFPKGTLLSPFNDPSTKLELFDQHQFLFGIADQNDGRTQKTFNINGVIYPINGYNNNFMQTMLSVPQHFGYGSQLFWVDAGYYDTSKPGYVQLDGMHPYKGVELGEPNNTDLTQYDVWGRTSGSQWLEPTSRGTITLAYDPTIRDQSASRVSIWRFGLKADGSIGWTNLGGIVNTSQHTVSAPVDSFGYFAVMFNTYDFDDTDTHPFARDQMDLLYARGIMNSKDSDTFGAYETTTRGEFAEMMVKALGLPLDYDPNNYLFLDVPHSLYVSPYWDYRYIETAGQKGIVSGLSPRIFAPNDSITREQAAEMIATAFNLKLSNNPTTSKANLTKVFGDAGSISTYALTSVEAVYKAGLMVGSPVPNSGTNGGKVIMDFNPQSNMTRAEVAVVTVALMQKYKRL